MKLAMKIIGWTFGALAALVVVVGIAQTLASERVEVVELHTLDEAGELQTTRLWIVDDEGFQYLRVGGDGSGWFSRIKANDTLDLTRNGETVTYTATMRPDKSETINKLMNEKYTWGDDFIQALVGGRDGSIAIELHPVT